MKTRYSNVPNTPSDSRSDLQFKDRISSNPDCEDEGVTTAPKALIEAWIGSLWALVLHHVLSIGVTILVLTYVDGHHFNVTQRSAPVHTRQGIYNAPFNPLQSDVTTALSSAIVVLKCALMAWVTPLIWRVAIFLMERRGLARRDLKVLLRYGVLTPGVYRKDFSTLIIGPLLVACIIANLSSPILTGSISWVPSNQLAHNLPIRRLSFNHIKAGIYKALPTGYRNRSSVRGGYVTEGAGRVAIGWGRDKDTGVLKRVSPAVDSLAINSTVENVTLPFFQVHSIRWIKTIDDIVLHIDHVLNYSTSGPTIIDRNPYGSALLLPDPNSKQKWSNDSLGSTIVRDTRLLMLYYGSGEAEDFTSITQSLPPGTYTLTTNSSNHYAFAWVTFSAGAGQCREYQCLVSSPSTIQNITSVALEPHPLTFQAVSLSPAVAIQLVDHNASIPFPWNDIDAFVEAVLVRSYSGAWTALLMRIYTSTAWSAYSPSFPGLLADVDHRRVYLWLGIHLLVTFLGTLFIIIQHKLSQHPLIGDTTLTAFYLDTTEIPLKSSAAVFRSGGVLKVEPQGDRLKVKL